MREALKLAREHIDGNFTVSAGVALAAIDKALAQPEQEPVAIYQYKMGDGSWIDQEKHSYDYNKRYAPNATVRVVYTTPPQRTWVGLTDEDVVDLCRAFMGQFDKREFIKATEAKLKEKNT